jgi:3-hydroxyisobutyrate dehydrogenase-like beta-hydroxyacid dehydrogenase
VIISLCPPANAVEVATSVAATGFAGVYVDGNAIAPARVREIARLFDTAQVVDGCVIGPPPHPGNGTRLYLSGESEHAQRVAGLFDGRAVEAVLIDGEIGQASALKMAFGSYNKATGVLAAVSHALADAYGVGDHLLAVAGDGHLADPGYLTSVAARAWRWAPEMREVAATLNEAGLPADLALAAASVLESWDGDQDDFEISFREVLDHLRR